MRFSAPAIAAALALASLSACGQRGPLYLPPPDAPPHSSPQAQPGQAQAPAAKTDDEKKNNKLNSN